MKIIKQGVVKHVQYQGVCEVCGCVIECEKGEARQECRTGGFYTERTTYVPYYPCPTHGCLAKIYLY